MDDFNSAPVRKYLIELQDLIVARLEQVDGRKFRRDNWNRPEGGGGICCILEEGNVLERGGVAFSHVMGDKMPPSATAHRPELAGRRWEALGVSLVMHPRNPYAPTAHANVRMFVAMKEGEQPVFWFGGSMDITPYYGFEEDAVHFHQACKDSLAPFGDELYPKYKNGATIIFISNTARNSAVSAASFSTIFPNRISQPRLPSSKA